MKRLVVVLTLTGAGANAACYDTPSGMTVCPPIDQHLASQYPPEVAEAMEKARQRIQQHANHTPFQPDPKVQPYAQAEAVFENFFGQKPEMILPANKRPDQVAYCGLAPDDGSHLIVYFTARYGDGHWTVWDDDDWCDY